MKRYEILGLMKDRHVSLRSWADACGEAPKTIKTHFEKDNLTKQEILAFGRLIGENDLLVLFGLFFAK